MEREGCILKMFSNLIQVSLLSSGKIIWVSDQARYLLGCTITEDGG